MLSDPVRKRFRQLHTAARHKPIDDSVDDEKIIISNRHCDRFGDAVTLFLRKMMSTRPPFGSVYRAAVVAGIAGTWMAVVVNKVSFANNIGIIEGQ